MISSKGNRRAVTFDPGLDTLLASITAAIMIGIYYLNAKYGFEQPAFFFIGFVLIGHIILNATIPAFVVLVLCKEGLSSLGIKRENLFSSILISAVLAAIFSNTFFQALEGFDGNPIPHIIFNGISLWEPLFVYGWLQLRFERAFGYILAPIIAGAAFAAYHIGTFPIDMVLMLFGFGVFYGVVFGFVRNILVLFPMTWAVGSSIGTIQGGYSFDWSTVIVYAIVLLLQVMILFGLWHYSRKDKTSAGSVVK